MRKLNVTDRRTDGRTDGQTDGGRCNISRPGPPAPREIKTLEDHPLDMCIPNLNIDKWGASMQITVFCK